MKVPWDEQKGCFAFEPETDQERDDLVKQFGPFDKDGGPTNRSRLWKSAAHFDGKILRFWPERTER
jgi:hypothetical protein